MKEIYTFTDEEKANLEEVLSDVASSSPYINYYNFHKKIIKIVDSAILPKFFIDICEKISRDRNSGKRIHVLKNCPGDKNLPNLDLENPVNDKYLLKKSFCSEAFLDIFAYLLKSPLFSYASRNNGDFFTDVICINRFRGKNTGFTDGDLIYHNDRTSHPVQADYITLLGMKCPKDELIYTNYIDGKEIIDNLTPKYIEILKKKIFYTEVDDLTQEKIKNWNRSKAHAIINGDKIWFQDTLTKPIDGTQIEAVEAILALRNSMTKSHKWRHKIEKGDLLVFPNQYGLHNREKIEIINPEEASRRWLLKTYTFENKTSADVYSDYWKDNIYGCVNDKKGEHE